MPKYLFNMTDDMTADVEAHRVKRGFKTTLDSLRELVERGLEDRPAPRASALHTDGLGLPVGNIKKPMQKGAKK